MQSEVLMTLKMWIVVLLVVMHCSLVGGYHHFERKYVYGKNVGNHLQDCMASQPRRI
jgi:hypothetical protein